MTTSLAEVTRLHESTPLTLTEAPKQSGRRMRIKVITPGWGSSGYYGPKVLEQVGRSALVPPGTHMYLDHPTDTEAYERPERSVKDLAAVTVTTATWDADEQALMAEVQPFAPHREVLAEQAPYIGVSIRASGTAEPGEAEGRTGQIITRITEVHSIDFVTAAGRGGAIVALLESARQEHLREARNIGAWLEAGMHSHFTALADRMYGEGRLTRDERICLSSAVGEALAAFVARVEADAPHLYGRDIWAEPGEQPAEVAESLPGGHTANSLRTALDALVRETYAAEKTWTYVEDHTDTEVIFRVEGADATCLYRQTYVAAAAGALALSGERVEVRATTTYTPVAAEEAATDPPAVPGPAQASPTGPVAESQPSREGDSRMAENTTSDAELASLREAAARTLTAEAALAEARANLAEARAQLERLGDNSARLVEAERQAREAVTENRRLKAIIASGPVIDAALDESDLPSEIWPEVRSIVTGAEGRSIPLSESGAVDTEALKTSIGAAVEARRATWARVLERAGAGKVRGLGESGGDGMSASDIEAETARIFRAAGLSESAAAAAAKGR